MARKRKDHVDTQIDRNLKRAFDEVADEPLPDRFRDLLDRLKREAPEDPGPDTGDQG